MYVYPDTTLCMSSADTAGVELDIESLTVVHWVGIVAALVSAAIHVNLGIGNLSLPLRVSFLLAGLGFLGAIGLVLLGYRRRTVYALGIPYTLAQIVAWYVLNFGVGPKSFPAEVGPQGAVDKVAQVALICVLIILLRGEQ